VTVGSVGVGRAGRSTAAAAGTSAPTARRPTAAGIRLT
jgi:hypothetical protein